MPYREPWNGTAPTPQDIVNGVKWELFDLTKDWTQNRDVSAANPDKLKELQDLFWVEAAKYQVLPLDASALTRFILPRPSIVAGRDVFTYTKPIIGVPLGTAPSVLNKSFTITADIEVPEGGGSGMLVTQGGRFGGWGFYLLKGKPVFVYDLLDLARPRVESERAADARQTYKLSSPSNTTAPASAKAEPASSRSTASRWVAPRFLTRYLSPSRPARHSTWAPIPEPASTMLIIRRHSRSTASSTS